MLAITGGRNAGGIVTAATPPARPRAILTRFADKYGRPVSTARRVPPTLYVPWPPRGVRVPSGNMITQLPCAM